VRNVHGKRIEACVALVSEILRGDVRDRKEALARLERLYRLNNVEPIRGKSRINIIDKEMCTVYLVARYGLGLDYEEYKELFEGIFHSEVAAERAAERILGSEDPAAVIREELGYVDENTVFRVARLEATAVFLGFRDEDRLVRLIRRLEEAFPDLGIKINGFKRFYIAFKLAQEIASGKIRNRLEKEAYKHALCVKLNAGKAAPPDDMIRDIATNVLKVEESIANNALKLRGVEAEL